MSKNNLFVCALAAIVALSVGCKKDQQVDDELPKEESPVTAEEPATTPDEVKTQMMAINKEVPEAELVSQLATDQLAMAVSLYKLQPKEKNLVFSPYSLHTALSMTWAGATGETADQMAGVIGFTMPEAQQHAAANQMAAGLEPPAEVAPGQVPLELGIANRIWPQKDYPFEADFVKTIEAHYGGKPEAVDYKTDADGARKEINAWVAEQTRDKIEELIPEGVLDSLTRLVLTNAVYFKGAWVFEFYESATKKAPFMLLGGESKEVDLMHQVKPLFYRDGESVDVVALPYQASQAEMVILLPEQGKFGEFVDGLDSARLTELLDRETMTSDRVALSIPKFEFRTKLDGVKAFKQLGLELPFDSSRATFYKMSKLGEQDRAENLYISAILHEGYIAIDEKGTEAAAATAVVMSKRGGAMNPQPPFEFKADRPFVYVIRDNKTGAVLFMGHVVDP